MWAAFHGQQNVCGRADAHFDDGELPQPRLSLQDGGGYKTIPWLSEAGSVRLAWALIVISLLGNAVAIVFTAATGGLAWQS